MSNKDFYFKKGTEPKKSVKVTSTATIKIPLIDQWKVGDWNHGFGIPFQQSSPKGYFDENISNYDGDVSKALLASAGFGADVYSIAGGSSSKQEQVNKILRRELTAEKIYQDNYVAPLSFFAMYKSWDSSKFTDFILENLVGKALTQAILYNYFGYPVSNIGRVAGRSGFGPDGQTEEYVKAFPPGSNTLIYTDLQKMGKISNFGSSATNLLNDQDGFDQQTGVSNFNFFLLGEEEQETLVNLDLRITQTLAGSFGESSAAGNSFSVVYSNSKTSPIAPTNLTFGINYFDYVWADSDPWDYLEPLSTLSPKFESGRQNTNFDAIDQKLTPTHAKMFMPGLNSAVYPSLAGLMGGEQGAFTTKWYHGNSEQAESPAKYFKYSNLVSSLKLVPPGIDPSQVQEYLDNPEKTLNEVIKNVFEYVMHVVPQNVRYAGPKPTIKEPGTDSITGENKPEACEDLLSANQQQVNRIISGSFFELNSLPPLVGYSKQGKENYLGASDPDQQGNYSGDALSDVISNVLWGKGSTSLFKYNRPDLYEEDPARYLYNKSSTKMDAAQKEYSYKFGLPPTNFIGIGQPLGLSGADADSIPGSIEARKFTAIPRNRQTIKSMFDSLPDSTRLAFKPQTVNSAVIPYYGHFFNNPESTDSKSEMDVTRFITSLWLMYHFGSIPPYLYGTKGLLEDPLSSFLFYDVDLHANGGQGGYGIYADMVPLIFQHITKDPSLLSYLPAGSNINISALSNTSALLGTSGENHFLNKFKSFFGNFSDVGDDATGTLFSLQNILNQQGSAFFAAKNNVPYGVSHKSPMKFPVWNYSRENTGQAQSLNSIVWPKIINNNISKGLDYTKEDSPWTPYLEQNPSLINKERKCVPDWCNKLVIYPTVEKEPVSYGLISPDFGLSTANIYYGENKVLSNTYLNEAETSFATVIDSSSPFVKNYKDENLSLYEKAKPYVVIDYEYDTNIAVGELYEKHPSEDFPSALEKDYRQGEGSSEYYRQLLLANASLTYAVDLDIDEVKLVADMVRHGVFALAGESDEYRAAGLDLDDIFKGSGDAALYSESLKQDYEQYKKSIAGTLESVDFSQIPSFLKGPDVSQDMLLALDENLPIINQKYDNLVEETVDISAATSYVLVNKGESVSVTSKSILKVQPGERADSLAPLTNFTVLKVLKESVNGENKYDLVRVVDPDSPSNGVEGYIERNDIVTIEKFNGFFSEVFESEKLQTAKLDGLLAVKQLTEGQRVVIPTWWTNEVPYYHTEDAEYWYAVELEDTCVLTKADLELKKEQALRKGVEELFAFHGKLISSDEIDKFIKTYLTSRIEDYYIDIRPGENVKFLLKVGAIYLQAFPNIQKSLAELKGESSKILTLDTRYYINHLVQAGYGLNQMYLDIIKSDFRVQGVNFALEAERLDRIPVLFKKLVSFNGYLIASEEQNLINIGFDSEFNVTFISYNEGAKEDNEKLLNIGFEYIKEQEPFNVKNTMSIFFYHRQLKNPLLKWQQAIKEMFLDPKPTVIPKSESTLPDIPSSKCKPPRFTLPSWQELLGPIAGQLDDALQLDPRFDLGSFQFSLTDYLPPCPKPPTGKGGALFRGEVETESERLFFDSFESLTRMKDLQLGYKEYVGDFMSSAEGLRQIGDNVVNLDDLWSNVLRRVGGLDAIYSKICKCFLDLAGIDEIGVPNFKVDLQGPSAGLNVKPLSYVPAIGSNAPANQSVTGGAKAGWQKDQEYEYDLGSFGSGQDFADSFSNEKTMFDAEDLICSYCLEIPDFFLRLPTTNILDFFLDALLKALEYILAQLLVELFATLLELLLKCPEITCPEGVKRVVDYGAQDLSNIIATPGIGPASAVFESCGIIMDEQGTIAADVEALLADISSSLSSGEVLELLDGSMSIRLSKVVQGKINKYPSLASQLPNTARARDFFRCVGFKVQPEKLAKIENDIIETFENPDICDNIYEQAKAQLRSKCGDLDEQDKLVKAATEVDLDNYIKLANLIRKVPDLTQQIPSLFADDKGNKGILSGLPNPTIDHAIEQTVKNMFRVVEDEFSRESTRLTNANANVLVKASKTRELLTTGNPLGALFYAPLYPSTPLFLASIATQPNLSKNALYKDLWFPINDRTAPYTEDFNGNNTGDDKYLLGVDDILTDLATNSPTYLSTNEQNVSLNVQLPEFYGQKVKIDLFFSNPDVDEQDNLVYTNNLKVFFDTPQIIEAPYSLQDLGVENKKVSDSMLQQLEKYPLEDANIPPQKQYFARLFIDKALPPSEDLGSEKYNKAVQEMYPILVNDMYASIFSSILSGISETIGNSELLRSYNVDLFDDLAKNFPIASGLVSVLKGLWEAAGVDITAPTGKKELGLLSLKPEKFFDKDGTYLKGLMDMKVIEKKVKDNYDFSNYDDPNSNELGMSHFALLEGALSAYIQIVSGDILVRALPTISKFPKFLLTEGDMLVELILKSFNKQLDESGEGEKTKLHETCMEMISRRSVFTYSDPEQTEVGNAGMILDKRTGKEYAIENSNDAIRFLIRENLDYPLDFIFAKLGTFGGSGQSFTSISQVNPLDLISYNAPLFVHDTAFSNGVDTPPANDQDANAYDYPSSLFSDARFEEFKNGKFVNQVYYQIEEWADEAEAQAGGGIYVESLVNRDAKLKGVLSQDNLFELIRLMSGQQNLGNLQGSGDGLLTLDQNQNEPFVKFFKSINLGTRFCYAFATSELELNAVEFGGTIEDGKIKPYSDGQSETLKSLSKSVDELIGITGDISGKGSLSLLIDEDFKKYIELTKSILVIERDDYKLDAFKTYIFPIIESKIDLMNNDTGMSFEIFNEPTQEVALRPENIRELLFEEYGISLLTKNLTNIVLSDEYGALLQYSFPTKDLIDIFTIFNIAIVSADPNVKEAFSGTKNALKTLFNSIYDMTGPEKYKMISGPKF